MLPDRQPRRGRLPRALAALGALALVLALGVGWTARRGAARRDEARVLHQARLAAARGNAADLHQALGTLEAAPDAPASLGLAAALWTDLWLLHREPGAEARARAALERAVAIDARVEERFAAQALHRLEAGDARGAADLAEARRQEGYLGPRLLVAQARALQALGQLPLARAALTRATDGAEHDGNVPAALGEALLEQGQPGAGDAFRTALTYSPQLWRGRLGLALARARLRQRLPEAEAALADARAHADQLSAPQRSRVIAIEAGLRLAAGDAEAARAAAQRAVDLDPAERWGRFFLGLALATRGEGATAATELEALARGVPGAPVFALEGASALQQAGQAVTAQGLLDRYRDFYQPALGSGLPGDDLYWLARGEVLEGAGRGEEALQAYDAALAARGGQRSRAVYAKAALLRARRDLAGAQRLLEDITPEDGSGALPEAYLALGELRFGARDYAQGSQAFALGLARLQQAQAPPARRSQLYLEVKRRLEAAGQAELARLWEDEARGFTR